MDFTLEAGVLLLVVVLVVSVVFLDFFVPKGVDADVAVVVVVVLAACSVLLFLLRDFFAGVALAEAVVVDEAVD